MFHSLSRRAVLAALATLALAGPAAAQTYPNKPIKLIVPFAAGGSTDVVGRLLANRIGAALGQNIVVDNRTGAGGVIGSDLVAKSPPDGYTLLLAIASTHAMAPALDPKLPYDVVNDFTSIGQVGVGAIAISVRPDSPYKTVKDLIAASNSRPVNYGTGGIGTGGHLVAEALNSIVGGKLVHIPYRGGAPAMTDLVGKQIDAVFTDTSTTSTFASDGQVRVIGVAGPKRSTAFPDVPNLVEQGIAFDAGSWFALLGPKGMPQPIVERLNTELNKVLAAPDVVKMWIDMGLTPVQGTPAEFTAVQKRDVATWIEIVKKANIKID